MKNYAMWCDQCQTAFSPKDPLMMELTRTGRLSNGESYPADTITLCGKCAVQIRLGTPVPSPIELEAGDAV